MSSLDENVKHQLRQNITSPRAYFMVLGISVAAALGYGIYTGNNTILVAVSGLMASLSVFLVYTSMKATYEWNRRKTTAEIIDKLMIGEFSKKTTELQQTFSFHISDRSKTYDIVIQAIPDSERTEKTEQLDILVAEILSSLEYMAMMKKHCIIDDDICYDFLGFVVTELYRWSLSYLSKLDTIHPRLHTDFRNCGEKWSARREKKKKHLPKR